MTISLLDSRRFGISVFKAGTPVSSVNELDTCLSESRLAKADLTIFRVASNAMEVVQEAEQRGSILTDTLVYFSADIGKLEPPAPDEGVTRLATMADGAAIREIASEAFHNYVGHYHADPKLDRKACDQVYISWAENEANANTHDAFILIALEQGVPVGFLSTKLKERGEAEIVLNAVFKRVAGRGHYTRLVQASLFHAARRGASTVTVSTQIRNLPPQRAWARCGFLPTSYFYTFHLWAPADEKANTV
jgi:hypothetical protein